MNENQPQTVPPVPPFVRFVCSSIPMTFDDSLSYYEALSALWKYMQDAVNVINNNATIEEEYIQLTKDMKDYMDHYFDNLDVQSEINNKLDQMVETGEFQTLLDTVITPEFNEFKDSVNQTLNNFDIKLESIASGAPIPVSSTADMTDTTRIYLLTSSGHWYYYNGSVWTDGGVYQATAVADNAITPNKLSEELRDYIGYQYINEIAPANTLKNYYYPFDFEVGRPYKFTLTGAGVQYINKDVIVVESVDDNEQAVDSITKIVNTAGTVTGVFTPSASATQIHVRVNSYIACTVSFEIEKQIDTEDMSDQTRYDFGAPFEHSYNYASNATRSWTFPYEFKVGESYNVRVTNTQTQFVSAPTLAFGTLNTPSTAPKPTYVETIDSYNSWQPYSKSIVFTPTVDAKYFNIFIHNYSSGTYTIYIEKLTTSYVSNPIATVVTNPRANSDDYGSVSDALSDGASAILVLDGIFTETIGARNTLLPDIIGISNNCSVLNRATGQYTTPPIQCAKCNLSNLKITETYAGDETSQSYCLHIDDNAGKNTKSIIENCNFEDNKYWCVGLGLREGQEIIFRNCNFSNCQKCVYMHNGGGNYEGLAKLKFINCTFESSGNAIALQDYNGNGAVEFTFINCNVKSGTGNPVVIEYKNYGDNGSNDNTWAHMFSLSENSYGNNIELLNA